MVLLLIAWMVPQQREMVLDSAQFSLALFAALLTGEAVIFAISFSASSTWPSLREIDEHIAFREWVVVGSVASLLTAYGFLVEADVPATYGALLFLFVGIFGMFSFVRLFNLASTSGRKKMLRQTLDRALAAFTAHGADLRPQMSGHPVITAFLGQLDESAARSDSNGISALVEELADDSAQGRHGPATTALHLQVLHRIVKAALVGKLDAVVAASASEAVVDSLLRRADAVRASAPPRAASATDALPTAVDLGTLSRYLAWLANAALALSTRNVSASGTARELIAMTVDARLRVLRLVDPDPPNAAGAQEVGTPLTAPGSVLSWIWAYTQFHGAHQAAGMYAVHEILTGTKFLGNYWDGASILTRLRAALFDPDSDLDTQQAAATRVHFGSVAAFDHLWTLMSVDALATLRDRRAAHPPELIRPEFTPDPRLLGAYVHTFASHRYAANAEEALDALIRTVMRPPSPRPAWQEVRSASDAIGWAVPIPATGPHERLPGCVLALAGRLAPLAPRESSRELERFLDALSPSVLRATARLAARTLPVPSGAEQDEPRTAILDGLQVLQLVGRHEEQSG